MHGTELKKQSIIKLTKDEFESELSLDQLEINYNIDQAVEDAYNIGREKNIISNNFDILSARNNKKNIDMQIQFNEENLNNKIEEIKGSIPNAMKDNSYCIEESDLIITRGTQGNTIIKDELKNKIIENIKNINNTEENVELPLEESAPGPIDVEKIYNEIHTEAQDAYYTKDPFTLHPHVNGVDFAISIEEAKQIVAEEKEEYIIPLKITIPKITTDKLGDEAFPDLLASFTTNYDGGNVNRSTNLRLASNKINGTVVMPGETFSYNATVGERTIAAGYRDAKIYQNGQVIDGLGGGICQISSTLYNAVVLANLDIVSRRNHGFVTSYLGAGRDATVVYGATDFRFKNSRKYPIKIVASAKNGIARVAIYGMKQEVEYKVDIQSSIVETIPYETTYIDDENLPEGTEEVEQKGQNGCRSVTYKVLYLNGVVVSRNLLSSDKYNAMEKVIRRGVKKPEVVQQPAQQVPTTPNIPSNPPSETETKPNVEEGKESGNEGKDGNTESTDTNQKTN